jgi:hypothetical protein
MLSHLKHFSVMNKLKKMVLWVIVQNLSEEELTVFKEMFKDMDMDASGVITFILSFLHPIDLINQTAHPDEVSRH